MKTRIRELTEQEKRSLKGLLQVKLIDNEYIVNQECS